MTPKRPKPVPTSATHQWLTAGRVQTCARCGQKRYRLAGFQTAGTAGAGDGWTKAEECKGRK